MSYNDLVKQHFFAPLNVFNPKSCKGYTEVEIGAKALGDAIKIYLLCDKKSNTIKDVKYEVYGNPYLIAALSYVSENIKGKAFSQCDLLSAEKLISVLELPKTKFYCAYMVEDAVNQVIQKWRENND